MCILLSKKISNTSVFLRVASIFKSDRTGDEKDPSEDGDISDDSEELVEVQHAAVGFDPSDGSQEKKCVI